MRRELHLEKATLDSTVPPFGDSDFYEEGDSKRRRLE